MKQVLTRRHFLRGLAGVGLGAGLGLSGIKVTEQNIPILGQERRAIIIGSSEVQAAGVADYVCNGVQDDVQLQAALDALPSIGGKLVILAGTYNFTAIVSRAIDNVVIEGVGFGTLFNNNGATALFSAGSQDGWVFRDFATDAGGLDYASATNYTLENIMEGVTYRRFYPSEAGYSDAEAIIAAKTIKLDDFASPEDNTDLDATTSAHGLLPKGNNDVHSFLRGEISWGEAVVCFAVRKGSVGTIALGKAVYISGWNAGGWVEIELADADVAAKMPCIGLVAEASIGVGADGHVMLSGVLTGLDTSGFSVFDELYVSTTAGELTATKPTGASASIQKMGQVLRAHNGNGLIAIFGAGRQNAVPNLDSDTIWKGSTGNATETLSVTEQTLVGRITSGNVAALSIAQIQTLLFSAALPEDTVIILDALLSADEHWSGISEIGTMGYGATVGDLVYLAVADTKWELAKADVAATSKGKLGIVLETVSEDATCQVLLYGKMRSAAFPALTVGAPVFISAATAGDMTMTAPTGTPDFVVRVIGYGNTAEDLFFCPDNTWLEIA